MKQKQLLSENAKIRQILSSRSVREEGEVLRFSGDGAFVVADFGAESASGYMTFCVDSFSNDCKLRISYSDRLGVFDYEAGRKRGDFSRGAATYLGVELPVLPANPNRFELYSVCRTGMYVFPLIQGQMRFACIALEGDAEIAIRNIGMRNASCNACPNGAFRSSDEKLNRLWEIGARTLSIATVRARQLDSVDSKLLLRPLTRTDGKCFVKGGTFSEMLVKASFSVSECPLGKSSLAFLFRSAENGREYRLRFGEELTFFDRATGKTESIARSVAYDALYEFELRLYNGELDVSRNGESYRFRMAEGKYSLGFEIGETDYAVIHSMYVEGDGKLVLVDCSDLEAYTAFCGDWFVSDGAKRDRLPWSGDLEWAGKNAYYCFGGWKMKETIELLLAKQNPEGYFWGVTYPEDMSKPASREWGLYQSDTFSCWLTVVIYRYMLFTDDKAFLEKHYDAIRRSLDYLWNYVGDNGLFYQRLETSKGLWDNSLGDIGTNTYANILISYSMSVFAELATYIGKPSDAEKYGGYGRRMKNAIERTMFDESEGLYISSRENPEISNLATALAMALRFCDIGRAQKIRGNYKKLCFSHGKALSLLIEGLYLYGFTEDAEKLLKGKNEFCTAKGFASELDWYGLSERQDCPHTVSECMLPPRIESEDAECWGDRSHPDAAVSHILSGQILGIYPTDFGFKKFRFQPHLGSLESVEGIVPTPYGKIFARADIKGYMSLRCPKALQCENRDEFTHLNIEFY